MMIKIVRFCPFESLATSYISSGFIFLDLHIKPSPINSFSDSHIAFTCFRSYCYLVDKHQLGIGLGKNFWFCSIQS